MTPLSQGQPADAAGPHTDNSAYVDLALTVAARGRGTGGRLAPRTRVKHAAAWRVFEAWCKAQAAFDGEGELIAPGLRAMPASAETLARFAAYLLDRGYARQTVTGAVASVRAWHRLRGEAPPDGVAAWSVVLRAGHDTPSVLPKVNPMVGRRGAVAALAGVCDPQGAGGVRDRALVTVGWALLAGVEELHRLDIGDVRLLPAGDGSPAACGVGVGGMVVRLSGPLCTSGHGPDEQCAPTAGDGSPAVWCGQVTEQVVDHDHDPVVLCPVAAMVRWLGLLAAGGATGPLWRAVDKGGNIGGVDRRAGPPSGADDRLTTRGMHKIWQRLTRTAGLPPSTLRALRVGAAWDLAARGTPLEDLLTRARWRPGSAGRVMELLREAATLEATAGQPQEGEGL